MVDVILMVENPGRLRVALALIALVVSVPSIAWAVPLPATTGHLFGDVSDSGSVELTFAELINAERTAAGLYELASFDDLVDGAQAHATEMADAGDLYHNPDLSDVTGRQNWFSLGENVGYGSNVDTLHEAFMDSTPHAANVLNELYNYFGVGAAIDGNGTIWVTVIFMYGPDDLSSAPAQEAETSVSGFEDIAGSTHEAAIAAIAEAGITSGCDSTGTLYCPDDLVSRAQMATFLATALDLPEAADDYFTDDDGSRHEDSINRLAAAGVTVGCAGETFCPEDSITRGQMATFLVRAIAIPDVEADYFIDDAASSHQASINALAASGITGGCGAGTFCPLDDVTRAQMATFLARALHLI